MNSFTNERRREWLNQLKTAHDLRREFPFALEANGRTVKPRLVRGGKYAFGLCPFHPRGSGTPSLAAYERNWICYSCGRQGDLFTAIMLLLGVSFFDAVEQVAGGKTPLEAAGEIQPIGVHDPAAPPPALPASTLDDYFEPLTVQNAEVLLRMGFDFDLLQWADIRVRWPGVYGWPIYERGELVDVDLYDPITQHPKWMPLFEDRGKHLYLYDQAAAQPDAPVFLFEGKKDALLLVQWGESGLATGGAGVWKPDYAEKVAVFEQGYAVGDNDDAGRKFNARLAKEWPRVVKVDWRLLRPGLPKGFDLGKFILAGGTHADFLELVRASEEGRFVHDQDYL